MPITLINGGDQVCDFRTKVNELITALNAANASNNKVPVGIALDWYGDPEDTDIWDANGVGVTDSDMDGYIKLYGQTVATIGVTTTVKKPDGSGVITAFPNPQGKFSVARDELDADFASVGQTGGEKEITQTPSQSALRQHYHNTWSNDAATSYDGGSSGNSSPTVSDLLSGGVENVDDNPALDGEQDAIDPMPILNPYFVWIKIMKYK